MQQTVYILFGKITGDFQKQFLGVYKDIPSTEELQNECFEIFSPTEAYNLKKQSQVVKGEKTYWLLQTLLK